MGQYINSLKFYGQKCSGIKIFKAFLQATRGLLWVKAGDLGEIEGLLCPTITFSEPDILLIAMPVRTGWHIPFGQENSYFFVTTIFIVKK